MALRRNIILSTKKLETYETILSDVRKGKSIPSGTEFTVPHDEFGDIIFVTRRQNVDKLSTNPNAPTLTIQSKYLLQTNSAGACLKLQFDGKEAMFEALSNDIPNGTTLQFTSIAYNSWTAGTWHFTTNTVLPVGTLLCLSGRSTSALTSLNVEAYSSPIAVSPFATMPLLSGDGDASINLGTWGTTGNHPHRISDGSNNLFESNIFQWMNTLSNGQSMGQKFVQKTKYDMLSPNYTNRIGFLDGFPVKFRKCLGLATIHNITNIIYESNDSEYIVNSECNGTGYFWLISRKELYGTNENENEASEQQFEYYSTQATTDTSKIGYTKDSSTKYTYWLRTPYRKFAGQSRISNSDLNGALYNTESNLNNGCGISPIAILA